MEKTTWTERDKRYSIDWDLTVKQSGEPDRESRVFDVSMGGCSILSEVNYLPGQELKFFLRVPDVISEKVLLPNPVPVRVKVVWCKELLDKNQVGVAFIYLSPIIRRAFVDAFEEFSADLLTTKGRGSETTN